MKKIFFTLALFITFLIAKEVKIGVALPLNSIELEALGYSSKEGLETAYELNHTLSNQDTIKLVYIDHKGDSKKAQDAIYKLISEDNVSVVLSGVTTKNVATMALVAKENRTPMVVYSSVEPSLTKDNNYITRVNFIDKFQGTVIAKYAFENNLTKAIVIENNSSYYKDISNEFKNSYTKKGGAILESYFIDSTLSNFNKIEEIKAKKPDIIAIIADVFDTALLVKQIRAMGIDSKIVVLKDIEKYFDRFIKIADKTANRVLYISSSNNSFLEPYSTNFNAELIEESSTVGDFNIQAAKNLKAKAFIKRFYKKYTTYPDALSALMADAYWVTLQAMQECINSGKSSDDKECINNHLKAIKNYKGLTNILVIKNSEAIKPALINEIKNLKPTYKTTIDISNL